MQKLIIFFLILSTNYCFATDITGTGASFPYKFLKTAFQEYQKKNKLNIKYSPSGSKKGYEAIKDQKVDFAAVDMYLKSNLLNTFPTSNKILHIPICLSGIGIAYNLQDIGELKLSAKLISEILIKNITNWNDKKIQNLNPNIKLPDLEIVVIIRSGGSGSTYLLTKYLSKLNLLWKNSFGTKLEINFPGCILANNSQQMQKLLSQIPGSFGYIAYSYKDNDKFKFAAVENITGNYVKPSIKTITNSANTKLPNDSRTSLINSNAKNGYPLSSFSWIITYENQNYNNKEKLTHKELKKLLKWLVNDGQQYNKTTGYSPLPENAKKIANNIVNKISYK